MSGQKTITVSPGNLERLADLMGDCYHLVVNDDYQIGVTVNFAGKILSSEFHENLQDAIEEINDELVLMEKVVQTWKGNSK